MGTFTNILKNVLFSNKTNLRIERYKKAKEYLDTQKQIKAVESELLMLQQEMDLSETGIRYNEALRTLQAKGIKVTKASSADDMYNAYQDYADKQAQKLGYKSWYDFLANA